MKVLYLTESYINSKVHHNLCSQIGQSDVELMVFGIQRENQLTDLSSSFENVNYEWHMDHFSGNHLLYRILFSYKQSYKYRKLTTIVNLNDVGLIHATTMFSDGFLALRLFKERGVPYIISVRGTDTDIYAKYVPYLWRTGIDVLKHAKKIIFISPTAREALFSKFPFKNFREELFAKTEVIPNGIDHIWLDNSRFERPAIDIKNPKLLYVGLLDYNKNVLDLMNAVDKLADKYPGIKLTIVGGGGDQEKRIRKRCHKYPMRYEMLGKIYDKRELMKIFRSHDVFTMVSHGETFGLVYVEALSQGLPILYSKGRGIDGVFHENIGEGVDPYSVKCITEGLDNLLVNYSYYETIKNSLQEFSWEKLSQRYIELYKNYMKYEP